MENTSLSLSTLDLFQEHLLEDEKSKATIEKYMRDVRRFYFYLRGTSLNKSAVLEYKAHIAQHYTCRSANSMLAAVNKFLRFLNLSHLCVKQFKVQKEAYCPEERELTKDDYLALVRAAKVKGNQRLSLVVQTICSTGIRVSELESITVEAVQKGQAVVSCKGKTRKIFIISALRQKLLKYAKENQITSGVIFITKNGKPLNRSNIWREMKSLCFKAGVSPKKVFPHNLRHLFARTFYSIEKDIAKLADILGHTNINTTRIYIVTTGEEHRRRMESMRLII